MMLVLFTKVNYLHIGYRLQMMPFLVTPSKVPNSYLGMEIEISKKTTENSEQLSQRARLGFQHLSPTIFESRTSRH